MDVLAEAVWGLAGPAEEAGVGVGLDVAVGVEVVVLENLVSGDVLAVLGVSVPDVTGRRGVAAVADPAANVRDPGFLVGSHGGGLPFQEVDPHPGQGVEPDEVASADDVRRVDAADLLEVAAAGDPRGAGAGRRVAAGLGDRGGGFGLADRAAGPVEVAHPAPGLYRDRSVADQLDRCGRPVGVVDEDVVVDPGGHLGSVDRHEFKAIRFVTRRQ